MNRLDRYRPAAFLLACICMLCGATRSFAAIAVFQMTGVHWHNTTYIGNGSQPYQADYFGTGSFSWTYTPGSFANGTGSLLSLTLPPWGVSPGYPTTTVVSPGYPTTTVVDANGVSSTLAGSTNVDNLAYDYSMTFSPALSAADQTVSITGGSYQFSPGTYNFLSGEFDGTIIGGTVSPVPEPIGAFGLLSAAAMLLTLRRSPRQC